jgi:hypothetical protein
VQFHSDINFVWKQLLPISEEIDLKSTNFLPVIVNFPSILSATSFDQNPFHRGMTKISAISQ